MTITPDELTLLYDAYLTDIESYFAGRLSHERLREMLVSMANDGFAGRLQGALRDEFDRMWATGEIVSVIQNAWDDLNECVIPSCFEKTYFTREDAALIQTCQIV